MDKKENETMEQVAALKYDPSTHAPTVVAKGSGEVAKTILEIAQQEDIPVFSDPTLAKALNHLEIGEFIPPDLFEVVAEILVFVDDLGKTRKKMGIE